MHINQELLRDAVEALGRIHPFYTLTFLVCKEYKLPIGKPVTFPINTLETHFLQTYFQPDSKSDYFFRISRIGPKTQNWLKPDHAGKGSQKTRTSTFRDVFIHPNETDWGWAHDYIKLLREKLKGKTIPAFYLAAWLYRNEDIDAKTTAHELIERLFGQFHITKAESVGLFNMDIPTNYEIDLHLVGSPASWQELRKLLNLSPPPDAQPEEGGILSYLALQGIGAIEKLSFEPAERLNVITGDNGLGKTFLLECAWWALTGKWAGLPALPRSHPGTVQSSISFLIGGSSDVPTEIIYDKASQLWTSPTNRPTIPGLLIYARVDGSFAVWDPARDYWPTALGQATSSSYQSVIFDKEQVWNGLQVRGPAGNLRSICNGMLHDWITWQSKPDKPPFTLFSQILKRLSPPETGDIGELQIGSPTRIPYDSREIPTIKHPYGEVPIIYAAAGVRRILSLTYLIVWAWNEHLIQSNLIGKPAEKHLVILVDEVEAHLHPQWQRSIMPALLGLAEELSKDLTVQSLVATHSPLITASIESFFDSDKDALFHLDLQRSNLFGLDVEMRQLQFERHGNINAWLMSDTFELKHARALDAEHAIEQAKSLQLADNPSKDDIQRVSNQLSSLLSTHDEFWPRWLYFAEKHGVVL